MVDNLTAERYNKLITSGFTMVFKASYDSSSGKKYFHVLGLERKGVLHGFKDPQVLAALNETWDQDIAQQVLYFQESVSAKTSDPAPILKPDVVEVEESRDNFVSDIKDIIENPDVVLEPASIPEELKAEWEDLAKDIQNDVESQSDVVAAPVVPKKENKNFKKNNK
jgi:hypothetical protein